MAIGTTAAIIGGSLGAAAIGASSSRSAAKAAQRGTDSAIEEQRRQFDEIMRLTGPQREIGNQSMNAIAMLLGLPGFTAGGGIDVDGTEVIPAGGMGDFNAADALANIPGNEVIVNDMMRRIRQSSPTTGGNVLTALADRVGGFQSDRLFNSLFQLAGFGPSGTSMAVQGAGNSGNAISGLLQSSGLANASGIMGQGQAINSGLQNVLQWFTLKDLLGKGGSSPGTGFTGIGPL